MHGACSCFPTIRFTVDTAFKPWPDVATGQGCSYGPHGFPKHHTFSSGEKSPGESRCAHGMRSSFRWSRGGIGMSEQSPCSHAPHQDAMPRLKPVENRGKAARHNPIHMRKDGRAHVSKSLSSRSYLRPRFPLFSPRTPRSAKRHSHQGTYRCTSPLPRKMSPCPDTTHTTTRKIPPTGTQAVFTRDPSTPHRTSTHSNPWPLTPAVPAAPRAPPNTAPVPRTRTHGHPLVPGLSEPKNHQPRPRTLPGRNNRST